MGNNHNRQSQKDQFRQVVKALQQEKNKQPVKSVDANPQQRYRNLMSEVLKKTQLKEIYKINLQNCIRSKLSKDQISSVLILLNNVKINDIPQQVLKTNPNSKIRQTTKNVQINFNGVQNRRLTKILEQNQHLQISHLQDTIQGRSKTASDFLIHEITKAVHPFSRLCDKYTKLLKYDQTLFQPCKSESEYEKWQGNFRKNINQFCKFLIKGCLQIYKRWIINYTGITQKKYEKWIQSIVINQIWSISNHNLYKATKKILNQNKAPLNFSQEDLASKFLSGLIKPQIFNIDKELQIEGHYFGAVYEFSELTSFSKPTQILKQLVQIKNSICLDIDNYHRLSQKNQVYEVNGENIMGIVAYLLSKIALKINEIYLQLLFLRIVYGQPIYYSMDASSYMFSTIVGALDFFEGNQFQQIVQKLKKESILQKQSNEGILKSTQCCGSFADKNQFVPF